MKHEAKSAPAKAPGKQKKAKTQIEAAQQGLPADGAAGDESQEDPGASRRGVWEVTYESGAIIGYYEGTPKKIAAFLVHRLNEGKYIKGLNFLYLPIQAVPEVLMKEECCTKRFAKQDNFCSRCGKSLRIDLKLPVKMKLNVSLPRKSA